MELTHFTTDVQHFYANTYNCLPHEDRDRMYLADTFAFFCPRFVESSDRFIHKLIIVFKCSECRSGLYIITCDADFLKLSLSFYFKVSTLLKLVKTALL